MESKFKMPTEEVELPSKGLIYPEDNPLSKGVIEMKYMSAREEDILTNENYIKQGVVLDKLLKALVVTEGVDIDDLVVGDKNAILVAARILGYGKDYKFEYKGEEITVDLSELDLKYLDENNLPNKGVNEFTYTLPHSENPITYKLLTGKDELKIRTELKGLSKISKNNSPELTTRLKHMLTSVNGETEMKDIRYFVDNMMLAKDSRALRSHIKDTQPDIDMSFTFTNSNGEEEDATIPMTAGFFWPDV